MASTVQSLVSNPEENKWVVEINEILANQHQSRAKTPSVSLFQVPNTITTKKPQAYEPQHIGLGPIHHFRPQPYKKMEQRKLAVVRKVLQDDKIEDYDLYVLDKVRKLVPIIRSCYDVFLHANDNTLASIFAIDGLFLLNLLHTYDRQMVENNTEEITESDDFLSTNSSPAITEANSENQIEEGSESNAVYSLYSSQKVSPERRLAAKDIMMVENQIPFMVLKEIEEALHPISSKFSSTNSFLPSIFRTFREIHSPPSTNSFLSSIFRTFCEIHSPLELCSESKSPTSIEHLLHYMYCSVVKTPTDLLSNSSLCPVKENVQAYEQTVLVIEPCSKSKILNPSASKLHEKGGYNFSVLEKYKGIQDICTNGKDFYLPCVTLNSDSDVIFRNLVAYETLIGKSDDFPLTEYVALMCALIVNVEDVKLLKTHNVIKGELGDVEVVKLFNGLSKSMPTIKAKRKSKLQEVIDDVNKVYESGLLNKVACWLGVVMKAIGDFVGTSLKIVAFMVTFATVFYLIWQAYCDGFGCDKTTLTLLPFSSS